MTNTISRLKWLQEQFTQLENAGAIRSEGISRFYGARDELADIINTYQDAAPVQQSVMYVMTPEQVDQVAQRMADSSAGIVTAITEEIERSDVAVLSAVVQASQDTVAALQPAH